MNDTIYGESFRKQLVICLKKLHIDSNIMDFEIIAHLGKHWKTIGNPEAVDAIFSHL